MIHGAWFLPCHVHNARGTNQGQQQGGVAPMPKMPASFSCQPHQTFYWCNTWPLLELHILSAQGLHVSHLFQEKAVFVCRKQAELSRLKNSIRNRVIRKWNEMDERYRYPTWAHCTVFFLHRIYPCTLSSNTIQRVRYGCNKALEDLARWCKVSRQSK